MTPEQLKSRLAKLSDQTLVEITDLTGTQDHYEALIVSPAFEGKTKIEQHRMIFSLVDAEVKSGEVHALTLKTYTPKVYEKMKGSKGA